MTAKQIKKMRKKTGLSQAKFAKKFGLNFRTLQGWETRRKPSNMACQLLKTIQMQLK
jgi:DNA-binding transcriptional regulator YiaG